MPALVVFSNSLLTLALRWPTSCLGTKAGRRVQVAAVGARGVGMVVVIPRRRSTGNLLDCTPGLHLWDNKAQGSSGVALLA